MQKQSDKPAALYYRTASTEQERPYLDNQMRELLCHAERQGHSSFIIYADTGASGLSESRPALDVLKADIAAGRIGEVAVTGIGRIGRSLSLAEGFITWARSLGTSVTDTGGTALPELWVQVMASVAPQPPEGGGRP
jgi:DNA invertase Pin-like site-specific DNA recombinase